MKQRTLCIVKPDAFSRGVAGAILAAVEETGLRIAAAKTLRLSRAQAEGFYAVHRERPFFGALVAFMTSGPVLAAVLEGDDAITKWRGLMGATDSKKAAPGTIRARFGTDVERNATHGSDAAETAHFEIGYLFGGAELDGLS
ncbi:MAG: nucleoside-diphosphate kinase [Myxococcota bacterium]